MMRQILIVFAGFLISTSLSSVDPPYHKHFHTTKEKTNQNGIIVPLTKARDLATSSDTNSSELKKTLSMLAKSVPSKDTDLYDYRPDQVSVTPPFTKKNKCPDKVESWRMEGEINEILSVALSEPKLSLFPIPDDTIDPNAVREGHVYAAIEHINRAHTFEGRLEGVRGNVIQAIERTKSALNVKSKPQAPDTDPVEEDSSVVRDVLLDCDAIPATSFISLQEKGKRVLTSKRNMRRESPTSSSWCQDALRSVTNMKVVNSTLTSSERDTFVKLACTWYEKRNDITACQRLELAAQSLVATAKRRKDLRDYDCVTSNETKVCSGKGVCHCSMCYCENGFAGIACESKVCKNGCGLHGYCVDGSCRCSPGWTGKSCQIKDCGSENDEICSGHGICSTDHIPEEFEGDVNDKAKSLQDALKHTDKTAPKAKCLCSAGYSGPMCAHKSCPFATSEARTQEQCSGAGHGLCDSETGSCKCEDDFTGKACEVCADTSHMSCVVGGSDKPREGVTSTLNPNCKCHKGYTGICCTRVACANSCSGHGFCDGDAGMCTCDDGWTSPDCSKQIPSCGGCGENGLCIEDKDGNAKCLCETGYKGEHCELDDCPKNCLAPVRGVCDSEGTCQCRAGFTSRDCSEDVQIDDDCAGDCADFCTHHTECTYDGQDTKIANAAVRSSNDSIEDGGEVVSFLEVGKTVECYWGCMRKCVRDKCV